MGKIYHIAHSENSGEALARGILQHCHHHLVRHQSLYQHCTLLLPNRRLVMSMRDHFMQIAPNNALIMPNMRAIGDVDEEQLQSDYLKTYDDVLALPQMIPNEERYIYLSQFINRYFTKKMGHDMSPAHCYHIAMGLTKLLDQCQLEQVALTDLESLVTSEYAEHWQVILAFLDIIRQPWQDFLENLSLSEPVARRNQLLKLYSDTISAYEPDHLLIIAGSTGSQSATMALMQEILNHKNGAIILNGLNIHDNDDVFDACGDDPLSPQYGFHQLLKKLNYPRQKVESWLGDNAQINIRREQLINAMMYPSQNWIKNNDHIHHDMIENIYIIEAQHIIDEARNIAIIMRQHILQQHKIALISDHQLLRIHVKKIMQQWGVKVDDSANMPLSDLPNSDFLMALINVCGDASDHNLIHFCKHEYCGLGISGRKKNHIINEYEQYILRNSNIGLSEYNQKEQDIINRFEILVAPIKDYHQKYILSHEKFAVNELLRAHLQCAEHIASDDQQSGAQRLWQHKGGEILSTYLNRYLTYSQQYDNILAKDYADLFALWIKSHKIAPLYEDTRFKPANCFIWSSMEARMQSADCIIIGNANEGGWPKSIDDNPWLSREMMKILGLQPSERRVGLNAHDFSAAMAARYFYISRAHFTDGAQQSPSRWLQRLLLLCDDQQISQLYQKQPLIDALRDDAFMTQHYQPRTQPIINPDIKLRPKKYSVSHIGLLINNPYLAYASYILKLKPLGNDSDKFNPAMRGNAIHQFCENMLHQYAPPKKLPSYQEIKNKGDEFIASLHIQPLDRLFFIHKFDRLVDFFYRQQDDIHDDIAYIYKEDNAKGDITLRINNHDININCKADRIDAYHDGSYGVIDYKSGTANQTQDGLKHGRQPQLPIEALILQKGGFEHIPANSGVSTIAYWQLSGAQSHDGGQIISARDIDEVMANAEHGIETLLDMFLGDNPMAYHFNDAFGAHNPLYQLARYDEWGLSL